MKNTLITTLLASASLFTSAAYADDIYVITNKADGNTIMGWTLGDDGKYVELGEFATGGTGTGDLEIPALEKDETHPLMNGDDPLISANTVMANDDGSIIASINPGDATIAISARNDDGTLTLMSTADASDRFPTSIDIYGDIVVAASTGTDNGKGSIGAYKIVDGKLKPFENSRRQMGGRTSTLAFSSDGSMIYVNELVTGQIKVFGIDAESGLSAEPLSVIDSPRATDDRWHAIPVGFAVRPDADGDVLLMSEARFLDPNFELRREDNVVAQSPLYSWQTGSVSSYKVNDGGEISILSADILTGDDIEGGEISNCWVAMSKDGKTLWAANALSSSLSSFDINDDGSVALRNLTAYKDESELPFYSDNLVNPDGDKLYQLIGNQGEVHVFDIMGNGDLELVDGFDGLPELGAYGMLVLD